MTTKAQQLQDRIGQLNRRIAGLRAARPHIDSRHEMVKSMNQEHQVAKVRRHVQGRLNEELSNA